MTVPTSAQKYPAKVLDDGADLYWRYDESGTPFVGDTSSGDQSGIHVNGPSLRQTPAAVTGPSTAIGFDGTDQIVYSDKRTTVPSQYSIETWFKTTTTRGGKLVGFGNNTTRASGNYDKHVYMRNDGRLVFGVWTGTARTITTPASYNNGSWHHVVATQGSSGMALYVDGAQVGTLNESNSQSYSGYWHVGGDNLNGWPNQPSSNYFAGQIDETAIYPSVLSAAQVQSHFTLASAPADSVQTVRATDDTYVNAGAPSATYGSSSSLAVRGSSAYESYLRFDLPAAPAGTVLKSARLAVKTTTLSSAGSTDDIAVRPVTGSWTAARDDVLHPSHRLRDVGGHPERGHRPVDGLLGRARHLGALPRPGWRIRPGAHEHRDGRAVAVVQRGVGGGEHPAAGADLRGAVTLTAFPWAGWTGRVPAHPAHPARARTLVCGPAFITGPPGPQEPPCTLVLPAPSGAVPPAP